MWLEISFYAYFIHKMLIDLILYYLKDGVEPITPLYIEITPSYATQVRPLTNGRDL